MRSYYVHTQVCGVCVGYMNEHKGSYGKLPWLPDGSNNTGQDRGRGEIVNFTLEVCSKLKCWWQ